MWYVLEVEGNPAGSTRIGTAQILGMGTTLNAAQHVAVCGFIDGMEGAELPLARAPDSIDFAYVVQFANACDRTIICLQCAGKLELLNT